MRLEAKKLLQLTLVVLIIIQISSWVLSKFTDIPLFKLGDALLLIILASGITILIGAGFKFGQLGKDDFLFLIILIGLMVLAYIYLPVYFEDIFSTLRPEIFSIVRP